MFLLHIKCVKMASEDVLNNQIEEKKKERYAVLTQQTEKATQFVRQMVLAGIAVVWMLLTEKSEDATQPIINDAADKNSLLIPLFLLCGTLFLELLHYISSIIIYWLSATKWLIKINNKGLFSIPDITWRRMWIPWTLFSLKIICAVTAYIFLAIAILKIL